MKKIWMILGSSLLVCALLLVVKNQCGQFLLKNANYGMPALIERREVENLFVGSSVFKQSLQMEALSRDGEDSYLVAYNGNQPVTEAWILEYLLHSDMEIGHLYLDLYPMTAWSEPSFSDEHIFLEVGIREKIELWQRTTPEDYGALAEMLLQSNNETLLAWPIYFPYVNRGMKCGGRTTRAESATQEQLESETIALMGGEMNPQQREAIARIVELTFDADIPLTYVETPKYYLMQEAPLYLEQREEYISFLSEMGVHMILLDESYEEFMKNPDYFSSMVHLSGAGMEEFSKRLSEEITAEGR